MVLKYSPIQIPVTDYKQVQTLDLHESFTISILEIKHMTNRVEA